MFGVGGGEFIVIALLALIVVGPEQLPGLMRKAGQTASQLRSMSNSLRTEFMNGIDQADVTKWGKGSTDDPVVPRGFSQQNGLPQKASMSDAATGSDAATEPGAAPDTPVVDPEPTLPATSPSASDPDEVIS